LLEHHSNVFHEHPSSEEEDIYESKESKILLLAKDNWDAPIIFTTMVQFLNVFYDGRNRNVRRLHNLSESVIIFDEVQKVPTHCISLFNRALNFLNEFAETSILLCTATQPALKYVEHQLNITNENSEIVTDLPNVVESFKRVDLVDLATSKKYSTASLTQFITNQIEQDNSILVILNTKIAVRNLFKSLKDQQQEGVHIYHLSTSMCPTHRNSILKCVQQKLKRHKKVICLSTQLIEAGVDIS